MTPCRKCWPPVMESITLLSAKSNAGWLKFPVSTAASWFNVFSSDKSPLRAAIEGKSAKRVLVIGGVIHNFDMRPPLRRRPKVWVRDSQIWMTILSLTQVISVISCRFWMTSSTDQIPAAKKSPNFYFFQISLTAGNSDFQVFTWSLLKVTATDWWIIVLIIAHL